MALKETISDLLAQAETISVVTADGITAPLFTRVWNNQVDFIRGGQLEVFQTPACFLELIMQDGGNMGQNYNGNDVIIRWHLVQYNYNTEGSFEQNLLIFDLRDLVVACFNRFKTDHLSPLQKVNENQDSSHDNIYHYTIDFSTHFVDSLDDAISAPLILSTPPLTLSYDLSIYKINSSITFPSVARCVASVTTFQFYLTFNTIVYFQNGTVIKLEYTNSDGTFQSAVSTGDGYTFDDSTMELTVTNINLFLNTVSFVFTFLNPTCKDEIVFGANVESITSYKYPGIIGTQQNNSQTYTPL